MNKWFAHIYFFKPEPDRINAAIPGHGDYWEKLPIAQFLGGPFADHSGGLMVFQAADLDEAGEIVEHDPFVREGLIETRLLKEWAIT